MPTERKRRLGRGLSSLIHTESEADQQGEYRGTPPAGADSQPGKPAEVSVGRISPNPYQPRRGFDPEALAELAESIRRQGLLQPLVVSRAADGEYTLIAGERRLRAAREAGLDTVPCILREPSRQEMLEWAIIENVHREDLNPIERARAYQEVIDRFDLTQSEVAQRLGVSRPGIANHLRLLDLDDNTQSLVAEGALSFGHAKVLASVEEPKRRRALAKRVVRDGLSVRKLERLATAPAKDPGGAGSAQSVPAYIRDLEERLTQRVGARVAIRPGRAKNTGRVVIDYYSLEDFDRIAGALGLDEAM